LRTVHGKIICIFAKQIWLNPALGCETDFLKKKKKTPRRACLRDKMTESVTLIPKSFVLADTNGTPNHQQRPLESAQKKRDN
jgi:hypothetical protein